MIEAFSRRAMRIRISNAALPEAANRERRGPIDAHLAHAGMIVLLLSENAITTAAIGMPAQEQGRCAIRTPVGISKHRKKLSLN